LCKLLGKDPHPARFPPELPRFFIRFLTDPDDTVLDIFSGSNTTGRVAEELGRGWISIESEREFAVLSAIRFMETWDLASVRGAIHELEDGRVLDLNAGISADPDAADLRAIGVVQRALFQD
jgi:site-specific DNA-methyltransferase (cytosine-N4-specific)